MKFLCCKQTHRVAARLVLLIALAAGVLHAEEALPTNVAPVAAAATNVEAPDLVRAYLQIQEQLHATQLTLERNRLDAEAIAASNTLSFSQRLHALETALTDQRTETQNLLGALAAIIVLALLFWIWLQARALRQLRQVVQQLSATSAPLTLANGGGPRQLGNTATAAGAPLDATLERLEKRVRELEGGAPAPAAGDDIAALLARGQALLNQGQAAAADQVFDEVLARQPQHPEALVKKGAALEKLFRLEDALACYDRAIAADRALTIAYLYKGGVFNRLERYDEALACYEQALRSQDKGAAN